MSKKTRKLIYGAVFIAIAVILGSFLSFYLTESIKISFVPAIIMFCGAALGPVFGAAAGAITDILSFVIGGKGVGAYFPGMMLTMAIYGILAGALFYKKQSSVLKISLCVLLIQTLCSLLLNTFWLSIMYGTPYAVLLASRVPSTYISCAIYIVLINLLIKNQSKFLKLEN